MSYTSPTGPINFREEGTDIAAKYIGNADRGKIYQYLTDDGKFGLLYGWGRNFNGQLGDGTRTHRSSPVQIGSLTNWSQISAGGYSDDLDNHSLGILV